MNRRAIMAALVSAGLGAGALHTYLARYEAEVAGGTPRSIVMVTHDLALGEVITKGVLSQRELPESYLEERHVLVDDLERVVGARVTSAVPSGSALLWSDLDIMQEGRTLSGLVRHGMRAYALSASDVSFEGLLRPGDRVDVLLAARGAGAAPSIVLENVLVLTVGKDLGGDDDVSGVARDSRSGAVVLSVTSEQAQHLAASEADGELKLLLRNPQDLVLREARADRASGTSEPSDGR